MVKAEISIFEYPIDKITVLKTADALLRAHFKVWKDVMSDNRPWASVNPSIYSNILHDIIDYDFKRWATSVITPLYYQYAEQDFVWFKSRKCGIIEIQHYFPIIPDVDSIHDHEYRIWQPMAKGENCPIISPSFKDSWDIWALVEDPRVALILKLQGYKQIPFDPDVCFASDDQGEW